MPVFTVTTCTATITTTTTTSLLRLPAFCAPAWFKVETGAWTAPARVACK